MFGYFIRSMHESLLFQSILQRKLEFLGGGGGGGGGGEALSTSDQTTRHNLQITIDIKVGSLIMTVF